MNKNKTEKQESETKKSELRAEILGLSNYDKSIQNTVERFQFSIKELENLKKKIEKMVEVKNNGK